MAYIATPARAQLGKTIVGVSDTYVQDGVFKFLGCSIVGVSMSLGYNGVATSVQVTLVEDTDNGDAFVEPEVPKLYAVSLPRGGVGSSILYPNGLNLNPVDQSASNVPFYFAGICSSWTKSILDTNAKTINVNLTDARDILSGVQCLLSGFALSHNIGTGSRSVNMRNIVDVFGYYDYGMTSGRNEYGMQWSKIQQALLGVRVTINDINFEFKFSGDAFNTPSWYRINAETMDLISMCTKVARDGGSDIVCVSRKANSDTVLIEIRAINRRENDPLTRGELTSFINARDGLVISANIGREYRTEPTSSVIIGGMRNSNYVAYPSEYKEQIHLIDDKEDYDSFPADIKVRMFGGSYTDGTGASKSVSVDSGAIFPFWGFAPTTNLPMIEPFLSLDHLSLHDGERYTDSNFLLSKIPLCLISQRNFTVRQVDHGDVFIDGDGDSDARPFGVLHAYSVQQASLEGYVRGLPLNTEVLRAALMPQSAEDGFYIFWNLYRMYYPDVAESLRLPYVAWHIIKDEVQAHTASTDPDKPTRETMLKHMDLFSRISVPTSSSSFHDFHRILYDLVRNYADEYMGKQFLVCLPKSTIMSRIWNQQQVPTNEHSPQIEYAVADKAYWETIPDEFDGVAKTADQTDIERQIQSRFMTEDGRFTAMAVINSAPRGNAGFNANGLNIPMFDTLPTSDFRPNRIAKTNYKRVYVACDVTQLSNRPDLALVRLPSAVWYDPTNIIPMRGETSPVADDENLSTWRGLYKFIWYFVQKNRIEYHPVGEPLTVVNIVSDIFGGDLEMADRVVKHWCTQLAMKQPWEMSANMSYDVVIDLEAVVIPLLSNWVAYGPWYYTYDDALGMVDIQSDQSLVPWNFERPTTGSWDSNLNQAGLERLQRTLSATDYIDNGSITVAGFPEYGIASRLGYNSNITNISVSFGIDGVRTTYVFATYSAIPGTYNKSDFDMILDANRKTKQPVAETLNISLADSQIVGTNIFRWLR